MKIINDFYRKVINKNKNYDIHYTIAKMDILDMSNLNDPGV